MSRLIKDKYRNNCLIAIGSYFAHTSNIKERISFKLNKEVKQEHILSNLKQLERDGYVKKKKVYGLGSGYCWELTKAGNEELCKLRG